MALQNPSNLYSGGQGVFDSRPVLMFQANLMAKKQAKEDALNKLYQDLPTSINSAGMQTKDLHILDGIKDQIGEYWKNNKQSIINPKDSRAQTEYQGLINQAHRVIQVSKNGGDKLKIAAEVLKDPKKAARTPKVVLDKIALAQLPVNDPNYRELEEDDFVFNAEPFDWAKQSKAFSGIKPNDESIEIITDPNTLTKTVKTKSAFDDEAKNNIYNISLSKYNSDPSVEAFVEEELSKPQNYAGLNEDFKKVYKRDIDVNEPAELYAAWSIKSLQGDRVKMKLNDDSKAKIDENFKNAKKMEGIRQGNRLQLLREGLSLREAFKDANEAETSADLDKLFKDKIDKSSPADAFNNQDGAVVDLPMSPVELKVFRKTIPIYNEDGSKKKDKSGKDITEIVDPENISYDKKTGNFRLVGKGYGEVITLPEMKTSYLNNIYSTKSKQNQLPQGSTPIKIKSSSSGSKSVNITTHPNAPKSSSSQKTKISW